MMLLEEFDPAENAVIDPEMIIKKIDDFPEVTISIFSHFLFDEILDVLPHKLIGYLHSTTSAYPIYEIEYGGERFAFYQSHVGEPMCGGMYEEIIAMGSRRLILLGNCGVLDKNIGDCGIIIPTKALRDEGYSYHFAPPSDCIEVNKKYIDLFKDVLENAGYPYVEGTTWTTDAMYRETRDKVERRRKQGAICVEMECAGMQAMCDFRGSEFFQFFYAGDNLDHSEWQPRSISGMARLDDKVKIAMLAFELGLKIKKLG